MSYQNQSTFIEEHIHRRFSIIKKVGSGAYGHVWKVQEKHTKKIYALKKIFDAFQHATDAQRTYRQIQILRQIDHQNIIKLYETIKADNNRDVYLVFQFVEADLHNVISQNILKDIHIRYIIYQIAKGIKYLHSGNVLHRDMKPSNILVNSNCSIKVCDFGLVRSLSSGKDQGAVLTEGVATRWYRAPEVLLGSKCYSTPADIWSFGCIVYEILAQKPLFNGSCTLDQVEKVCSFTGYPSQEDIKSLESEVAESLIKQMKISPHTKSSTHLKQINQNYVDLVQKMLIFNPQKRITIDEILSHQLVKSFRKIEEETVCKKQISTPVNDNKKYTVQEYRKLIYGSKYTENAKPKGLSSSLGAGSASPKYQPHQLNKTVVNFGQSKAQHRPELHKKMSFDKGKTNYLDETSKKGGQKQNIKYYKSLNNLYKGQNGYIQLNQGKRQQANNVPNREEVDSPMYRKPAFEPKFISKVLPKVSLQQKSQTELNKYGSSSTPVSTNNSFKSNSSSPVSQTSSNWKAKSNQNQTIMTSNEIKQKVLQFRSPKYTNKNSGLLTKTSSPLLAQTSNKKNI